MFSNFPKKYTNRSVTPCRQRKSVRAKMRRIRKLVNERKKQIEINTVRGAEMFETDKHNLQPNSTDVDVQQKPIESTQNITPEPPDCNLSVKIEDTVKEEPLDIEVVDMKTEINSLDHDIKTEFENPDVELNLNNNNTVGQSAPSFVGGNIVENPFEHWWSRDRVVRLIELFKIKPVLWDQQHPLYKNRDAKKKSLEEICDEIGASAFTVLKKIRLLQRYLLKELEKKEQWLSQGKIFRSTWTYFEHILFLQNAKMAKVASYTNVMRTILKKNINTEVKTAKVQTAKVQVQTEPVNKFDIKRNGDVVTIVDDKNVVTQIDYYDLVRVMIAAKVRTEVWDNLFLRVFSNEVLLPK